MTTRICSQCGESKTLNVDFFHVDSKNRQGFSTACKVCRNEQKRKKNPFNAYNGKKKPTEKTEAPLQIYVDDEWEDHFSLASVNFKRLSEKHQAHYVISVAKTGKVVLTVQSSPALVFKGNDVMEVVEEALRR